jgi:hypothetical protein
MAHTVQSVVRSMAREALRARRAGLPHPYDRINRLKELFPPVVTLATKPRADQPGLFDQPAPTPEPAAAPAAPRPQRHTLYRDEAHRHVVLPGHEGPGPDPHAHLPHAAHFLGRGARVVKVPDDQDPAEYADFHDGHPLADEAGEYNPDALYALWEHSKAPLQIEHQHAPGSLRGTATPNAVDPATVPQYRRFTANSVLRHQPGTWDVDLIHGNDAPGRTFARPEHLAQDDNAPEYDEDKERLVREQSRPDARRKLAEERHREGATRRHDLVHDQATDAMDNALSAAAASLPDHHADLGHVNRHWKAAHTAMQRDDLDGAKAHWLAAAHAIAEHLTRVKTDRDFPHDDHDQADAAFYLRRAGRAALTTPSTPSWPPTCTPSSGPRRPRTRRSTRPPPARPTACGPCSGATTPSRRPRWRRTRSRPRSGASTTGPAAAAAGTTRRRAKGGTTPATPTCPGRAAGSTRTTRTPPTRSGWSPGRS